MNISSAIGEHAFTHLQHAQEAGHCVYLVEAGCKNEKETNFTSYMITSPGVFRRRVTRDIGKSPLSLWPESHQGVFRKMMGSDCGLRL